MTNTPEWIAQRQWTAVDPDGKEHDVRQRVRAPVISPDGSASCLVDAGFGDRSVEIFGENSWQAVRLAMDFCTDNLRAKVKSGWALLWPDTRAAASDEELF